MAKITYRANAAEFIGTTLNALYPTWNDAKAALIEWRDSREGYRIMTICRLVDGQIDRKWVWSAR
jgi:hypothetical protein